MMASSLEKSDPQLRERDRRSADLTEATFSGLIVRGETERSMYSECGQVEKIN